MKVTFPARVTKIEEKFSKHHVRGVGENAIFERRSLGWYFCLDGSYESLFLSATKPAVAVGSVAHVTIELEESSNANP